MSQRTFEKENSYVPAFQLRTKNYSPLASNSLQQPTPPKVRHTNRQQISYRPQSNQNNGEEEPTFQYQPRPRAIEGHLTPSKHEGIGSYNKSRYEPTMKSQYDDKRLRSNNVPSYSKEQQTFLDHSFGDCSLPTDTNTLPQKRQSREYAKRRGLEIKMSNIETINDKINNLLSMVKKDKVDRSSPENAVQFSPKRVQSPIANRVSAASTYQFSDNKEPKQSIGKIHILHDIDRSHKRVKTHSAAQSNKFDRSVGYPAKEFNDEERLPRQVYVQNQQIYSPSKRTAPKQSYQERNLYEKSKYPSQRTEHRNSPVREEHKSAFKEISNTKASRPTKYEQISLQFHHPPETIKLSQKRQRTPVRKNGDGPFPTTILPIEMQRQKMYSENTAGITMIDNQIRKIKEKINQSEYQNKKNQERLNQGGEREERNGVNAGKIYSKDGSNKKFEIKLHPVINDKPETVKIAEKLCYQIEIDNRMRKPRQAFEKIEAQNKWEDLESKLNSNGIRLTIIEIKELISLSPQEFSPFDSEVSAQMDIVKPFSDSQKFWENQLCGCASQKALKNEGFNISELDLNKKGYLTIQDLVCFVNLYSAHFYKNRDLTIIFRRLQLLEKNKKANEIEFCTFFRAFTI